MAGLMVQPGILKVLIESASELESLVTMGQQQPYYVLEVGGQRIRSKAATAGSGTAPVWNTAHKFGISNEVSMRVLIKDEVTKGMVGETRIDLVRARDSNRDEVTAELTTMGGLSRGLLRYKLKFTPAEGVPPIPAALSPPPSVHAAMSTSSLEGGGAASEGGRSGRSAGRPMSALGRRGAGDEAAAADPTLRSVNDKVSLAKAAMQQLQAELVELASGGGSSREPPSPFGSEGAPSGRSAGAFGSGAPSIQSAGTHPSPQFGPRGNGGAAATATMMAPPSPLHGGLNLGAAARGGDGFGNGGGIGSDGVEDAESPLLVLEDIVAQYSRTAAEMSASGEHRFMNPKALCEAIESLFAEKTSIEEELSSVKRAMASMTKQHYLDLRKARQGASGAAAATSDPRVSTASGPTPPASPSAAKAVAVSAAAAAARPRSNFDRRASLNDHDNGVGAPKSPVAAHRLEIQLHQQERQIAEQSAKIEAQAAEMRALLADLDTARGASREAQTRAEAAVRAAEQRAEAAEQRLSALEAMASAAKADAKAARSGAESATSREAALAAELADLKGQLAAAEGERQRAEAAAAAAEGSTQSERAKLQSELAALKVDLVRLREEAAGASALRSELRTAQERLAASKGQSDEVEYLQQQLRRTLRQVVELQRDVQTLKSPRGAAPGGAGGAADGNAVVSENEFLMQELVATKVELAQLKEQQLVVQRQLRHASAGNLSSRQGSGNYQTE